MGNAALNIGAGHFQNEVLDSGKPVLVDLWAEWCGPCRVYGPVVERIASKYENEIKVVKVNIEEAPEIASKYGVSSIPTTLVFKNGEEVDRLVGSVSESKLEDYVKKILS